MLLKILSKIILRNFAIKFSSQLLFVNRVFNHTNSNKKTKAFRIKVFGGYAHGQLNIKLQQEGRHTGVPGLWTLDSVCWTLDPGCSVLNTGLWTLHFGLSGHLLLLLTCSEQNQNPISDSVWLNYWKFFVCESLRTSRLFWLRLFCRECRF